MGAILEKGPTVAQKCVYQYVRDNGLTAIDKGSGKILWQMPEGIDVLAEGGDVAYVFTLAGEIAAMDNVKCKKLYSVSIPAVSKYAVNVTDSEIYVADYAGRVACLKPIK
jgi:outer membrane protein assembly factor BamB